MKKYVKSELQTLIYSNDDEKSSNFTELKDEMRTRSFNRLKQKQADYKRSEFLKRRQRRKIKALKKKRRNERLNIREDRLSMFGERLEANLPASERWFRELYFKEDIKRTFSEDHFKDQYNVPFNSTFIPDVTNRGYKYIIEIDGGYHNTPEQQFKDAKRDHYFIKREYLVIRIKDRDMESYTAGIELIKARVKEIDELELKRRNRK